MKTLKDALELKGIGLHSGEEVNIKIKPFHKNGIWFYRTDLDEYVEAIATNVHSTVLSTGIKSGRATVMTIEHFLAACTFLNLSKICVSIDKEEFPIFDGSAKFMVEEMMKVGFVNFEGVIMKLLKDIEIFDPKYNKKIIAKKYESPAFKMRTNFKGFGENIVLFDLNSSKNKMEIASARTFGYIEDLEDLKSKGLAKGATLKNVIAMSKSGAILNPMKLNSENELTNHKLLDLMGDLRLVGYILHAQISSEYGGHELNVKLANAILSDTRNYILQSE